jgi:hypothetical protein
MNNLATQYIQNGLIYKNVCPICFCLVVDGMLEAHIEWHLRGSND